MNRPLETERLALRPFTLDDAEAWHAIWGDPEVIWWGASESFEKSRADLAHLLERESGWPDGIGWLAVTPRGHSDSRSRRRARPARLFSKDSLSPHQITSGSPQIACHASASSRVKGRSARRSVSRGWFMARS